MRTGIQWRGTIAAKATRRWFTWGWNPNVHVTWYLMSNTARKGAPQLDWDVAVERANANQCTYWITVKNLTNKTVHFEGRYAILS
ncbi:hypothetical protein [Desulfogranum marinum]|jgi:hypothetical protein|uniref:hypothetical protein n=1 Tax=Desulfogranum marinum TaxID=453220 RepID=UPI001962C488|nr:hypothetical protein [Desulfogranum marinum]MBM9513946.1 hypothetical protein [Desulfogranum marinum]